MNNYYSQLGLYGQCTWFAWGRFYELYGLSLIHIFKIPSLSALEIIHCAESLFALFFI